MPSQPSTFHLHCQIFHLATPFTLKNFHLNKSNKLSKFFAYQQHYIAEIGILPLSFVLLVLLGDKELNTPIDTDNKCFFFDTRHSNIQVTEKQAIIVAPLLAANGEDTDNDLYSAVENIAKQVPTATTSQIASGDFNNCFYFATEVPRRLGTANVEEFVNYHNEFAAKVKEKTNAALVVTLNINPNPLKGARVVILLVHLQSTQSPNIHPRDSDGAKKS
ncbi:uncharacterized protein C8R40DRAFT_1268778 [Lentinula edodes]|uniref:uncharacterized protein n=1 Tax=Lentinula edodes TaxID=5353 RepID=UPI001E8E3299|nr:uncharacterized protein C8R40DRAFT_1268778 [Lentinula edodes]KAH7869197.1 hypothetical protein C8R40DRAFT_1268778 [Lentinula edodes]